jgi:hypothetical protein
MAFRKHLNENMKKIIYFVVCLTLLYNCKGKSSDSDCIIEFSILEADSISPNPDAILIKFKTRNESLHEKLLNESLDFTLVGPFESQIYSNSFHFAGFNKLEDCFIVRQFSTDFIPLNQIELDSIAKRATPSIELKIKDIIENTWILKPCI